MLWNKLDAPLFIEGFPIVPRTQQEMLWFGRSQCDKQTKQTNYLHKYITQFNPHYHIALQKC
jgi:hypothetical protein